MWRSASSSTTDSRRKVHFDTQNECVVIVKFPERIGRGMLAQVRASTADSPMQFEEVYKKLIVKLSCVCPGGERLVAQRYSEDFAIAVYRDLLAYAMRKFGSLGQFVPLNGTPEASGDSITLRISATDDEANVCYAARRLFEVVIATENVSPDISYRVVGDAVRSHEWDVDSTSIGLVYLALKGYFDLMLPSEVFKDFLTSQREELNDPSWRVPRSGSVYICDGMFFNNKTGVQFLHEGRSSIERLIRRRPVEQQHAYRSALLQYWNAQQKPLSARDLDTIVRGRQDPSQAAPAGSFSLLEGNHPSLYLKLFLREWVAHVLVPSTQPVVPIAGELRGLEHVRELVLGRVRRSVAAL